MHHYSRFLLSASILILVCWRGAAEGTTELDAREAVPAGIDAGIPGFGILKRMPGLWSGPVTSTTPAGSFARWYVDFRPVSPGQVSQYSTLDADTSNFISFFVVMYQGEAKIALRTEGVFRNKGCVTYEVIDSVDESNGYYKFSDFRAGDKRAYTELTFAGEEMTMEVYTSKFGTVSPPQLHSRWTATRADSSAAAQAVSELRFPQPVVVKDFTDAFASMPESIFFTFENDPYSSQSQPYVGDVTVRISVDPALRVETHHELFLLLTTRSLFEGLRYVEDSLRYTSRYVFLPVGTTSYTFRNVHPGTYYVYSYDDTNADKKHSTGDYMSSNTNNTFNLLPNSNATLDTTIDFVIP